MKRVFFLLAMSAVLSFSVGCNDDDGPSCAQEDFLGTYTGTDECTSAGIPASEIIITAGASSNQLVINGGGTPSDQVATIDGCSFSWGETTLGTGFTGNGSIDGNMLTYTIKSEALGSTVFQCTFSGTK